VLQLTDSAVMLSVQNWQAEIGLDQISWYISQTGACTALSGIMLAPATALQAKLMPVRIKDMKETLTPRCIFRRLRL
jgi:hypothetical protein